MKPWHLDRGLLQRYEAGCTDLPFAGSIETHLNSCATCRRLADSVVPAERLTRIWQNIETGIDSPQPTIQRILKRLRLASPILALIHAITNLRRPPLRLSLLASGLIPLFIAIAMAGSSATNLSSPDRTELYMPTKQPSPSASMSLAHAPGTGLPEKARSLVIEGRTAESNDAAKAYLRPCLVAIDQQAELLLAADIIPYEQGSNSQAVIAVFQNSKRSNRLDAYVLNKSCIDGNGRLLASETDIPLYTANPRAL